MVWDPLYMLCHRKTCVNAFSCQLQVTKVKMFDQNSSQRTQTEAIMAQWMQCIADSICPLRRSCQTAGYYLWPIILLQKHFGLSLIVKWTAACGQRPVCLCGRRPANPTVESGWLAWYLWLSNCFSCLPVDSSILTSMLPCQVHLPICLTQLGPSMATVSLCQLNKLN